MSIYIGIDTGKSGAIAVIYACSNDINVEILDFGDERVIPTLEGLANDVSMCILERVNAMPNQGVKSMFSFGENFGWWQGVLDALRVPYETARPQEWMKGMGLPKDKNERKKAIHKQATRLYPEANLSGARGGMKDGRSDALMIAHYARKTYGG